MSSSDFTPPSPPSNEGDSVVFESTERADQAPPKPSSAQKAFTKFSNVLLSSGTVAIFRVFTSPPQAQPPPPAPGQPELPNWYLEDYKRKARYQHFARQYLRDTALLTVAAYLMEGVEHLVATVRGKDDALNKTLGGVCAGGMMGYAWFPTRPHARVILSSTGALVGYIAFVAERTSRTVLLEQQKILEKEVYGKSDADLRQELDPDYLRELIRRRQKQLHDAAQVLRSQQQQQQQQPGSPFPGGRGALPPGFPGAPPGPSAGAADPSKAPPVAGWVTDSLQHPPPASRASGSPAPAAPGGGFDQEQQQQQQQAEEEIPVSGLVLPDEAPVGGAGRPGLSPEAAAARRPSVWGSLFGRGGGGGRGGGAAGEAARREQSVPAGEMVIREEVDVEPPHLSSGQGVRYGGGGRGQAAFERGSMVIQEEPDTPRQ